MPIVSSTFTQDAHVQRDGSRYTIERHADDAGQVYQIGPYLVPDRTDVAAMVTARAAQINEQLAEAEAQALFADGA